MPLGTSPPVWPLLRKLKTAWVPDRNSSPSRSRPWPTIARMPATTSTNDTIQKMRRLPIQSIRGVPMRASIFTRSLISPVSSSNWKTQRVTISAVNRLNTTPSPSVMANPRTACVPTQPRIRHVIRVVALPSRMALAALV